MPTYCLTCPICGEQKEVIRSMVASNLPEPCGCGQIMERDYPAEHSSVRGDYDEPIISDSMAFDACDLAEHRKRFPNIDVVVDHARSARPIMRSLNERRAYQKARGFIDQNSFM